MTRAFLFPGQGSQKVGMGKDLADAFAPAREVFQEVDDALSQKLSRLMWEGPDADLTLTENAQPAIMALSLAIVRDLWAGKEVDFSGQHLSVEGAALAAPPDPVPQPPANHHHCSSPTESSDHSRSGSPGPSASRPFPALPEQSVRHQSAIPAAA